MTETDIYRSPQGAALIAQRYRHHLDHWPVPAEETTLSTRLGDTFVVSSGPVDGPVLVALHGSGANASTWRNDVAGWSREFRVHAVDVVGEPGGSAAVRLPLGSPRLREWLDDVLDGLGVARAALVGMSLGGWFAADYAVHRPDRVTAVALLCPGGIGPQRTWSILKFLALKPFGRWGLRRSARGIAGLDGPDAAPFLDDVVLTFEHFRPRLEKLPIFTDAQLQQLRMPVLAIVGNRDAMLDSAGTARRIRRNVPEATVIELPGVGHAIGGQTETIGSFVRAAAGKNPLFER